MRLLLLAISAAALLAPGSASLAQKTAAAARSAPASRDWTRTVVATAEGGFRVGNPAAPVKLVEYGSLTCSHCAHFAQEGVPQLMARDVRSGRVSYEFHTFVLNGVDAAATLLTRCAGPDKFFAMSDALYRTQPQWLGRISGLTKAQKDQLQTLTDEQRFVRVAEHGGLLQLAARFGVSPSVGKQCLTDKAGLDRIGNVIEAGQSLGVAGTPTFFINGTKANAGDWASLEPLLKRAG